MGISSFDSKIVITAECDCCTSNAITIDGPTTSEILRKLTEAGWAYHLGPHTVISDIDAVVCDKCTAIAQKVSDLMHWEEQ